MREEKELEMYVKFIPMKSALPGHTPLTSLMVEMCHSNWKKLSLSELACSMHLTCDVKYSALSNSNDCENV